MNGLVLKWASKNTRIIAWAVLAWGGLCRGQGPEPVPTKDLITPPSVLTQREPRYSNAARAAKLTGTVVLSIIVNRDGTAGDIKVVQPLGLGLDEEATEAVREWRFRPGSKGGEPVRVVARVEVSFRLEVRAELALPPVGKQKARKLTRGVSITDFEKACANAGVVATQEGIGTGYTDLRVLDTVFRFKAGRLSTAWLFKKTTPVGASSVGGGLLSTIPLPK